MKLIYTFLFLLVYSGAFGQKMPDYGLHKIRIADTDRTILAEIIPVNSNPEPQSELTYYWYATNKVHVLQGGYSGRLLNGTYTETYLNHNPRTQGTFKKGLKDGTWKDWDERGTLIQVVNWRNGIRSGAFSFFNQDGRLKESGEYRFNELNGPVVFHEGPDSTRTVYYSNGKALNGKPRSFFNKINIFKKKPRQGKGHA
jgi:antitoxin component YwqK of YwqJK toxin-antitoxin module